jgi:hypothetical protein
MKTRRRRRARRGGMRERTEYETRKVKGKQVLETWASGRVISSQSASSRQTERGRQEFLIRKT